MIEIRLHGYGGEGVVTMASLLAAAALKTDRKVQALPSFGVERRGAPVVAAVRISDQEILMRSQSYEPDLVLVLNIKLLDVAKMQGLCDNSLIILNAKESDEIPAEYQKWPLKKIDLTGIALSENLIIRGVPSINIPSFGALCAVLEIPLEKTMATICEKWPGQIGQRNAEVAAVAYKQMAERG